MRIPNIRLFLAIFLPFFVFFSIGRPFAGIICFWLQVTLRGWPPAILWAIYALSRDDLVRIPNIRLFLAIFLPFFVFFLIGRPSAGIICLFLQFTLMGWLPVACWAMYALSQYYSTDNKIKQTSRS